MGLETLKKIVPFDQGQSFLCRIRSAQQMAHFSERDECFIVRIIQFVA